MGRVEKERPEKHSLKMIIFFSILMRLIILPGELIHENDIYRYIWDGNSMVSGINPYKYAPADVFMYDHGIDEDYYDEYFDVTIKGKAFSEEDEWNLDKLLDLRDQNPIFYERIGHWQVPTIYPPVAQILFIIPVLINDHSLMIMKGFFLLFDIGSLFVIIALLKHFNKNVCMCIVYGWSPLVLFEIANAGHYDSIPIFLTFLSLFLLIKKRQLGGMCVLALATLSKFFSGILLPIVLRPIKMRLILIFAGINV